MEDLLTLQKENGTPQPNENGTASQRNGHLVFKNTGALSRGILTTKKGFETIRFNGDSLNTEL